MNVYTLKYLKLWENFEEGKVNTELILKCIKNGGTIFAYPVSNLIDNDEDNPKELKPTDFDEKTGKVTVEFDNKEYEVDLSKVKKVNLSQ
jgi:hypothetical protein